jgi:dTDP-4-dehydrorhamnose 3,5-epimerase
VQLYVERTPIPDLLIIEHEVYRDGRGYFLEVYREDIYRDAGLPTRFVQVNQSGSDRDVVRGLHFQWDPPMGKLMRVLSGAAYLVAVDIRLGSPTLGRWFGTEITAESKRQLWAPAGFARGFCVLSDFAEIQYLCTGTYSAAGESGVLWNDPAIGIEWPVIQPTLSARDRQAQTLAEWLEKPEAGRFAWEGYERQAADG